MPTRTLQTTFSAGGVSINARTKRTAAGEFGQTIDAAAGLTAGKASTAWTKTDANTGTATLASGHGLLTGDEVDVYWTDGLRYGMTCTVNGDDVTVSASKLGGKPPFKGAVLKEMAFDVTHCRYFSIDGTPVVSGAASDGATKTE